MLMITTVYGLVAKDGGRVKVNNSNYSVLAILFARRENLEFLLGSLLRRLAWMLQTGNYEIEQSVVVGKFGSASERVRIEALAALNEDPHVRATDLRLVELVFCASAKRDGLSLTIYDVIFRPAFALASSDVEALDLHDARHVRTTGLLPSRFASSFSMHAPTCGRALIVDLGFKAPALSESSQIAALEEVKFMQRLGFQVSNRLYEHSCAVDDKGYLSMGYALQVMETMLRSPPNLVSSLPSFEVPLHELMAYNSPLYRTHVERTLQNMADVSAANLGELLGVRTRVLALKGTYHSVVPLAMFQQLVDTSTRAVPGTGVNVAVLRTEGHHFLAVWAVGSETEESGSSSAAFGTPSRPRLS